MNHEVEAWGNKLDAMTADDILHMCEKEGIKANVAEADSCAIAQLIQMKTGESVLVTNIGIFKSYGDVLESDLHIVDTVYTWDTTKEETIAHTSHGTPYAINPKPGPCEFISKFDRLQYPSITNEVTE